ncbi:MAG: molybdopterin-dependent oxidoreductase [Deferribacterales bacterium]
MSIKDLLQNKHVSRRSVLKIMSATVATAALAGCGGGGSNPKEYQVLDPSDDLVYDKSEKIIHTTGSYNCGSRCLHYVHIKNGKVVRMTSAGDKTRGTKADSEAEYDSSEFGKELEKRACVRCYGGYQGILYQPDRLKYPMMRIDTGKPKGDVNNFKRVTWDEAIEAVATRLKEAYDKSASLGYAPIVSRYFYSLMMMTAYGQQLPYIKLAGNESYGGADLGCYDTVGNSARINSRTDRYNTKFMLTWALDVTKTTYWQVHTHFMNQKIKEKAHGDIPMVVISSIYSDAAAMLTTGVPGYQYSINGTNKQVDIPGWIACRPSTDSALAIGMHYVIYKNQRMDNDFMQQTTTADQSQRKCFGYWKNDEVISQAHDSDGSGTSRFGVRTINRDTIPASAPYNATGAEIPSETILKGLAFKVPAGESFEEYLLSREVEWGGATPLAGTETYKYREPSTAATPGDAIYTQVLSYIASLTGVSADIIEALAMKYSEYAGHPTDAALIETGGGAQRAWNASEWVWSLIGLSTVCGYINKSGGGMAGASMGFMPESLSSNSGTTDVSLIGALEEPKNGLALNVELSGWQNVVINGRDHRPADMFTKDINYSTAGRLTLSETKPLEVDVIIQTNINNIQTHPNVNKNILAAQSVSSFIIMDQVMTPTALLADIILPASTHFEKESFVVPTNTSMIDFYHREKAIDFMYDTLPEHEIAQRIVDKLNELMGTAIPAYVFAPYDTRSEDDYNSLQITDYYRANVNSSATLPSADELRELGQFTLQVPKSNPLIPMAGDLISAGDFDTSTGFINFYSPLRAMRPARVVTDKNISGDTSGIFPPVYYPGGWRNATLCYQPMLHGRETYFDNGNPMTGNFTGFKSPLSSRTYKMTYMTNKSRNRGHTVFDSVAAIKDMFPQMAKMNPATAAERGISEGDMVYVYNDRGCMKIPAHLTHEILPGIVSIEHGAWYRAHPTERVQVWMQDGSDQSQPDAFNVRTVPVDIGGTDNVLTNDFFGEDTMTAAGAVPAQSGPCEVSLTKPE